MTKTQKIITGAALALFLASLVWAPWASGSYHGSRKIRHGLIFLAPEGTSYLQWGNLIVEWLAIGILYGWLFWLFKDTEITLRWAIWTAVIVLVICTVAWMIHN